MTDIFPQLRATARADAYFASFDDTNDRFKFFLDDDAPSLDAPYITAEFAPAEWDQNNGWSTPTVTLTAWGKETDIPALWDIVENLYRVYSATDLLIAVGDYPAIQYSLTGKPVYDRGKNPVTEERSVSVALHFGIET